jgi:hypothetical protein
MASEILMTEYVVRRMGLSNAVVHAPGTTWSLADIARTLFSPLITPATIVRVSRSEICLDGNRAIRRTSAHRVDGANENR